MHCNFQHCDVYVERFAALIALRSMAMRVMVYDATGDIVFSYDTARNTVSLFPGRLEKARIVEALQEAAFFILDGPEPAPEGRTLRQHLIDGDEGEDF